MNRFELAVAYFTKGLHHFSSASSEDYEPSFSWRRCESCGSQYGGDRHVMFALDEVDETVELDVCTDCLFYHEYGDVPEEWWWRPGESVHDRGARKIDFIVEGLERALEWAGYDYYEFSITDVQEVSNVLGERFWQFAVNGIVFGYDWDGVNVPEAVDKALEDIVDYFQLEERSN